jgi:tetratricopeptide (TPR) repeat protein
MQHEKAWAVETHQELLMHFPQGMADYAMGRVQRARETLTRASDQAEQQGLKGIAADVRAAMCVLEASLGNMQEARKGITEPLTSSADRSTRATLAAALALTGDTNGAQKFIDELAKDFPLDTLLNNAALPAARAVVELQRKNPERAIALLEPARPYEMSDYGTAYLRGKAYLQEHDGAKAAPEFQKILDHRGTNAINPVYALARLELGRALALQGQTAQARTAYQDFLAFWKDADPDIPVLKQAKEEYEKLK